jgi:hypothetical protein
MYFDVPDDILFSLRLPLGTVARANRDEWPLRS